MLARVAVLERAAEAAMAGTLDDELREKAARQAHRLAGSLGTFGFSKASDRARELEHLFERELPYEETDIARACQDVVDLRAEVDSDVGPTPSAADAAPTRELWLVSSDSTALKRLRPRLAALGFEVKAMARQSDAVRDALKLKPDDWPAAIVLDAGPDVDPARDDYGRKVLAPLAKTAPVLLLAAHPTIAMRVSVAGAGASVLMSRDVEPEGIIMAARALLPPGITKPVSIVIIGKQGNLGLAVLHEDARVDCHWTEDAGAFVGALDRVRPDLMIIDTSVTALDLPTLSRLARLDVRWRHTPLAILVPPSKVDAELLANSLDADLVFRSPIGVDSIPRILQATQRATTSIRAGTRPHHHADARATEFRNTVAVLLASAKRNDRSLTIALVAPQVISGEDASATTARIDQALQSILNEQDALSSPGPDGQFIALYGADHARATTQLTTVIKALGESPENHVVRIGAATYPEHGSEADVLLDLASAQGMRASPDAPLAFATTTASSTETETTDILFVDDDETLAALLVHSLKARGYSVRWMADGIDAKNALLGDAPELRARLILLDVNLPSMDGLTLLRRFKDAGLLKQTKVIMLTARVRESEIIEALNLGASDHVGKPFSIPVLAERIRRSMDGQL